MTNRNEHSCIFTSKSKVPNNYQIPKINSTLKLNQAWKRTNYAIYLAINPNRNRQERKKTNESN